MNQPTWMLFVTFGIALVGAVLGVINTWRAVMRDRVNLRVVALWHSRDVPMQNGQVHRVYSQYAGALEANPEGRFGIRVINRGFVEVTVASVGITPSGYVDRWLRRSKLLRRGLGSDADDRVHLPIRLKPRESVTLWWRYVGAELDAALRDSRRIYVNTACGLDVFGTSRLFRRLTNEASRLG